MTPNNEYVSSVNRILNGIDSLNYGDQITYAQLSQLVGYDIQKNRAAFYSARKRFLREKRRYLGNVPGVGYRVIQPSEHLSAARDEHERARKEMADCVRILSNTDRSGMPSNEQRLNHSMEIIARNQLSMMRRWEAKSQEHERGIQALNVKTEKTTRDVSGLEDRLARLESLLTQDELRKAA